MNRSRRNPASLMLALALCWTLAGCKMTDWQTGYGPGGVVPEAGQFPGGPPPAIDLGNPSGDFDAFDENSVPGLSEPRTFETERPVIPPARTNPSRDVPNSNIPDAGNSRLSAPQGNTESAGTTPNQFYIPPLWGPLRLGQGTHRPFPEGRWRPPANPPVANRENNQESPGASQPLPLTKKAQPRGSFDFPWRRPEDVLNRSPETAPENDVFDLPPLVKSDAPAETGTKEPQAKESGPELPVLGTPLLSDAVPEFEVVVPPRILVGEATTITVRIAAPKETSFSDLKLIVTPDSGLVLSSAANESKLTLDCPVLTPGQPQKLSFDLQAVSSGSHEFTVSLKRGEEELSWKKLNLTAQPRQLLTQLIGPDWKPVNGRAELTLKIENVSQEALGPIEAILEFDSTLVPMEASAGAEQKPGQLVWSFPVLHPGELLLLQAEYACPVETGSTLVSSYVSIKDGPSQLRRSSLAVKKAAGTLQVEVFDRQDLSTIEREMTGVVRVTNLGLQPVRDLQVSLELPELLGFTQVTANAGSKPVDIKQEVTDATYTFTLPSELASEQTVEFAITFNTLKAGDGILQVNATADGIATPVRASEPFTVTP